MPQAEYECEAIEWSYIEFVDNQDVLDLIEVRMDPCRAAHRSWRGLRRQQSSMQFAKRRHPAWGTAAWAGLAQRCTMHHTAMCAAPS